MDEDDTCSAIAWRELERCSEKAWRERASRSDNFRRRDGAGSTRASSMSVVTCAASEGFLKLGVNLVRWVQSHQDSGHSLSNKDIPNGNGNL